ncbi:MAG: archaeosortase/exosortase family protein [Betaproteobacteria bacterium]|nr:archaeosortase/exosortase family protein [Betaproteobacteria bacterium]
MTLNEPPNPDLQQPRGFYLRGMELRFALVFLLLFFVLQYGYSASRGSAVEHAVIDIATVRPSAAAINLIAPEAGARASGNRIVSPHGSLSVLNGCEGTETVFLLLAAIAAFKATWRHKLKGALLGTLIVYGMNQGRIVALFFAAQHDRKWFDLLHGIIAPTLIIVLSYLFFLWWASQSASGGSEQTSAV